jgi:hypothetical protein
VEEHCKKSRKLETQDCSKQKLGSAGCFLASDNIDPHFSAIVHLNALFEQPEAKQHWGIMRMLLEQVLRYSYVHPKDAIIYSRRPA